MPSYCRDVGCYRSDTDSPSAGGGMWAGGKPALEILIRLGREGRQREQPSTLELEKWDLGL